MGRISLVLTALLAAGCGGSAATPAAGGGSQERLVEATAGLCEAFRLAAAGDVDGAAGVFQDRAHAFLHELANRLSAFDRQTTADLLVAKQAVEQAFRRPGSVDAGEVRGLIADLQAELARAAEAAGLRAPACDEAAA